MRGQTVILVGETQRRFAKDLIDKAGPGFIVNIKEPTRNDDQNAKMWAMLSDICRAQPGGRKWTTETWKCAFMHALGHQVKFQEGLDDSGPFPVGFRSSKLGKKQMGNLITCIGEYGDRHGVQWLTPERDFQ